jgi:ATP-dependent Lon protease
LSSDEHKKSRKKSTKAPEAESDPTSSEDERNFMRDDLQEVLVDKGRGKDCKLISEDIVGADASKKFLEMVNISRDLEEQLVKAPQNKILKKAVRSCSESMKKLIAKTRDKNMKHYRKLLHQGKQQGTKENEVTYFQNKLSNREQLRVLKELTSVNKCANVDRPYRIELLEKPIKMAHKALVLQRISMLSKMDPHDGEYFKMKSWVDAFMRIPFGKYDKFSVSIEDGVDKCHDFLVNAKETLDKGVHGLLDAKTQILQMVGQWISNPSAVGTAIGIHGPAGTGKTSLAKDGICKIYGRSFAFVSLGGCTDSSYLDGHGYTFEGSCFGRICQILMDCRSMNPIIYFDELDKVSATPKGEEIINMLIHLTDPAQNAHFQDRYFSGIDLDLSRCLFVFSYNDESKVSPILRDRMYSIKTKKYDVKEKIIIAREYLLPRIFKQVNFQDSEIVISDEILQYLINGHAFTQNEEGVRNLKRCLEIIVTKLNLFRLTKPGCCILDTTLRRLRKDVAPSVGQDASTPALCVQFPYEVTRLDVDAFVRTNDAYERAPLSMYI